MQKILLGLFLIIAANIATAKSWTNGGQVVGDMIWIPTHHGFYVLPGTFHDPEGCMQPGANGMYLLDPAFEAAEPKAADRVFAMILLAHSTKKKVFVQVDGCTGGYPKIIGMQLQG